MKLVWTLQAIEGWQEIADYIFREFGEQALRDFAANTSEEEKHILNMPNSGSIEWNDSDETTLYRYRQINRISKMLYFIKENTIYIADFWDVRVPQK